LGSNNEFRNCRSHDNGKAQGINGNQSGYGFYISGKNNLVEKCQLYNNGGYGMHVYNSYGGADYNTIRYNRVFHNSVAISNSSGIIMGTGTGNTVYGNLVYGSNANGITLMTSCNGCRLYNNTVYGSPGYGVYAGGQNGFIINNISYSNSGGNILNSGTGMVISNNITNDPTLVNPSAGDFRLQSGSIAIDKGVDLRSEGVTTDIDGVARPKGSAFEIGAYEYIP
jgi:parallel beta-helix repeat protein